MNKGILQEKILEIYAEGGSLSANRIDLGIKDKPEYFFVWNESSMPLDDEISGGFFSANEHLIKSFETLLKNIYKKYPEIFYLTVNFIHNDYKLAVVNFIRNLIKKKKLNISEMMSVDSWLNELKISKSELLDDSPFYSDDFVGIINKFSKKNFYIMEQNGWNRLDFSHSDFNSVKTFSKYLDSNNLKNVDGYFCNLNKSGVYAYFFGENCLYIGKAKVLKSRIISHYKSAHNYIKKSNPKDGKRQRELFNYYLNEPLSLFYFELDDKYNSKVGEHLRKTIEGMLQLEYKPEYDDKIAYTQQKI